MIQINVYSEKNCRRLVQEGIAGDKAEIERMKEAYYREQPVRVLDYKLQRNGNGRDFDLKPRFSDGYSAGYFMELWLMNSTDKWVRIYRSGISLSSADQRFSFYIKQSEMVALFPEFNAGQTYKMALDLSIGMPTGRGNSFWSESWLEDVWPKMERTQRFIRQQGIAKWKPVRFYQ